MFTEYIPAAMKKAKYELLEDGTFFGSIPECKGLWANESSLEACREELRSTLEDWMLLGIWPHHSLPVIEGIDLNIRQPEPA